MSKKIYSGEEARSGIFRGMEIVTDAVKSTMGPKGRNAVLQRTDRVPLVTNDGVTVANEIELEDALENIGASMIKETAEKTNKEAGDGTTSTVVLAHAIAKEGLRYIKSGVNPFALTKGLHVAIEFVTKKIGQFSKKLETKEEIMNIATISAQDEEVGAIIAECMEEIGHNGTITVEEGVVPGLTKEIKTGMSFDRGFVSPLFMNNFERQESAIDSPVVVIVDKRLQSYQELVPLIGLLNEMKKKNLVLIADEIDGDALGILVINKINNGMNILGVKAPGYGENKREMLKDIATITGATIISEELGMKIEEITPEQFGSARRIVATDSETTIIDGGGTNHDIEARANTLQGQIEYAKTDFERDQLTKRLAKLVGGIAIIRICSNTDMETKNKKYKIEDALNATRAGVQEGIVAGGGISLAKISGMMTDIEYETKETEIAFDIIRNAIKYPLIQIANNAGYKGDRVVEEVMKENNVDVGFNAKTGTFENLIETGIVDPTKVLRVALENAVSTACMFLTMDVVIVDKKEDSLSK